MSGATPATVALDRAGINYTLHPYQHDSRAELLRRRGGGRARRRPAPDLQDPDRLGRRPAGVRGGAGGRPAQPQGAGRAAGGRKAELADPAKAQRATGYVLGGISPLGHRSAMPVVIDDSVDRVRHGVRLGRQARPAAGAGSGRPAAAQRRRHAPSSRRPTSLPAAPREVLLAELRRSPAAPARLAARQPRSSHPADLAADRLGQFGELQPADPLVRGEVLGGSRPGSAGAVSAVGLVARRPAPRRPWAPTAGPGPAPAPRPPRPPPGARSARSPARTG